MALTISPITSLFTPQLQPTLNVRGTTSSAAATAAAGTASPTASASAGTTASTSTLGFLASELSNPETTTEATLLARTFGQSALLSQAATLGSANLSSLALVQSMFGNGPASSLFSYPSAVSLFPSFLQQLQSANLSPYNASGLIDSVQSLGTLLNVAG